MPEPIVLGWHLDSPKTEVTIPTDAIDQHTVVLAQSGGGKSFLLGRLVEEYLLKTKARVVVLDVNGDFRKSYEVADKPWKDPAPDEHAAWPRLPQPERDAKKGGFEKRWSAIRQLHLTLDASWPHPRQRTGLHIKWCGIKASPFGRTGFGDTDRLVAAGLDPRTEGSAYRRFVRASSDLDSPPGRFYTLAEHRWKASGASWRGLVDTSSVADSLIARLDAVVRMPIWADYEHQNDLAQVVWQGPDAWRLLKIDLMSVDGREARLVVANHALWALRHKARRQWEVAASSGRRSYRVPTFALIDEAHNLVPETPGDWITEHVATQIMRIASEGRKFGLFLILATQRPGKLRRGLLAECENVCVMRLQSPSDHEAAAATWGGPSPEIARARHFGTGDGLLMGRWVPAATTFHAAFRRTAECGGRLDPTYWAEPY